MCDDIECKSTNTGEMPLGLFIDALIELENQYGSDLPVIVRAPNGGGLIANYPTIIKAVMKEDSYEYSCEGTTHVIID